MGVNMGGKPCVDRSPEEKWQIVQEGMKSGSFSETFQSHGIAQELYYRSLANLRRRVFGGINCPLCIGASKSTSEQLA